MTREQAIEVATRAWCIKLTEEDMSYDTVKRMVTEAIEVHLENEGNDRVSMACNLAVYTPGRVFDLRGSSIQIWLDRTRSNYRVFVKDHWSEVAHEITI